MKRGICPIAVIYFAVKGSFFNNEKICWSTRVNKGTDITTALYCYHIGSRDIIGHATIRCAVGGFL